MSDPEIQKGAAPKRIIPKFTSFKPTTTLSTVASKETKFEEEKHGEKGNDSYRRHHRSGSWNHERQPRRDRLRNQSKGEGSHRGRPRERSRQHRPRNEERDGAHTRRDARSQLPENISPIAMSGQPSPESRDATQRKQYFMDTKGDENNLVYGNIYRYSIPDYRRGGSGRILGLPANLRIDRDNDDGKVLVLKSGGAGRGDSSIRNMRQAFAKLEGKDIRRLRIRKDETSLDEAFSKGLDFVPFSVRTKKRKTSEGGSDGSDINSQDHYRSIEGLKKNSGIPDDEDLDYTSESQSEDDYVISEDWGDRKRMAELSRKVEGEPKNIDAWLTYVNHYDSLISGTGRRRTAAEKRSTAEVKLDILQKALEKNSGDERLLLKYMDVAGEIWGSQKLLLKWKRVLEENPTIVSLWTKYINFRQADFLSFTYPECLKCFSECLTVLRSAAFRSNVRSPNREMLDSVILYVFIRTIVMMDESGYKENAVAVLQAMLELNLFRPPTITSPKSQREFEIVLEQFEIFWDSEVPRIGEDKALGWASYVLSGENGSSPDPIQTDLKIPTLDPKDPFGSWTNSEVEWSRKIGMPARTIDEVEEDDPYRVILFSDLKKILFCFSSEIVRKGVIEALLVFKNMPPLNPYCSNCAEDMFLRSGMVDIRFNYSEPWFWPKEQGREIMPTITLEGMEPEKKVRVGDNPFEFKLQNFPAGYESVFSKSAGWFDGIKKFRAKRPEDMKLIRNILKACVERHGDECLALYYFAWEWGNAPSGIKKVAKSLLKRFKTSLRLWSAYSQIECQDSGIDSGRKIFSMALRMSEEFSEIIRRDSFFLWHAWIWEELSKGNIQDTLRLILSIDDGNPLDRAQSDSFMPESISKLLLLKARRYLENEQHSMLSIHFNDHAGVINDIRAILEYLANGTSLNDAFSIYDEFISDLDRRSMAMPTSHVYELCLLRKARLVYQHSISEKPFKPATLRSNLDTALRIFPRNSAFLSLYSWNESRTRIENRVRVMIRDRVLQEGKETVIGLLFAIWSEMRMGEHYNVHAVRSLFERGVECNQTCSSTQLWMTFVEFEIQQREPHRAKEVLFRGIRHCPWSKDLIMMAFVKLREVLELEELQKLLSIMSSEKELRVHDVTELEDMIEEMENGIESQIRNSNGYIALPADNSTNYEMVDD